MTTLDFTQKNYTEPDALFALEEYARRTRTDKSVKIKSPLLETPLVTKLVLPPTKKQKEAADLKRVVE